MEDSDFEDEIDEDKKSSQEYPEEYIQCNASTHALLLIVLLLHNVVVVLHMTLSYFFPLYSFILLC
jgi:hypothetical protein